MKRFTVSLVILSMLLNISCGSRKKYSDIIEFIDEVVKVQDEFISAVDSAARSEDIVKGAEIFGDRLVKLSEKSMEIRKNYPEISGWGDNPPEELREHLKKLDDAGDRFEIIFSREKIQVLLRDGKVQESMLKLYGKLENVKFFR